jgi:PIN domain nuclease of toxin-antitoxin system
MRALLDTHTFLLWNLDAPQLSTEARELIAKGSNEIFLSAASAWQIAIEAAQGRLILPDPPDQYAVDRMRLHRFSALPIELSHALEVYRLPAIHQDPFDQLLIAQSQLEDMPILSGD